MKKLENKNIDIILRVIDNYGDIGFCLELLMAWRREFPHDNLLFTLWTDAIPLVTELVEMNRHLIGTVDIREIIDFGQKERSSITISLFHAPIPDARLFRENSLVLRIDYLSFDGEWNAHHGKEHILSTSSHRIIEIIPSPIGAGGQLTPYKSQISRMDIARQYGLDSTREWVSLFPYPETIDSIVDFDNFDNDRQVLIFGYKGEKTIKNAVIIPWTTIDIWHACIDESVWVLARGEVSAMATLCRGKLGFWDMYKELGGWHTEQSESFLEYIGANTIYRDIHLRLNGQAPGGVSFSELDEYMRKNHVPQGKNHIRTKNLIEEIKKYIDSHQFSI